ncbi:MAG: hypothetical protein GYB65_01795, partial [Chloroflexi bacterium]|nr:hypothetical protein [Chloroflexota bacterium]
LVRVAQPGELVAVNVVGYLAVLRVVMEQFRDKLLEEPYIARLVADGNANGPTGTPWHFFRAGELRDLAERCGLATITMAGCEGLSTGMVAATNTVAEDAAQWQKWVEIVLRTSTDPGVVEMAEHILYLGRKGA